ncbi:uncharacterized protein PGTG_21906 [Puccinia graminis f. sp. tritici CRL 75-36-700-3]|uniref:Reverse transcriptase domain-containing protein n=1 Tax=Puccinia graminis f. sp. tritici (strain CRL 75-36-700-3 / race SCCL) TaxID=418459 RepID=H6QTD7_PUCGT|nr:uncharacterized protein PGTG_21906 [Puccinia graminis f. sp. tritici CRL 75-36-700-3]EHS64156.1 hypothetical protein PGTG_21906 [Puccinia graminis f. sp. tritici CRL 75-36-700-3]
MGQQYQTFLSNSQLWWSNVTVSFGRGNHQERRREKRWNNQSQGWGQGYNYFNQGEHHNPSYNHYSHPFNGVHPNSFQEPHIPRQFSQENSYNWGGSGQHTSGSSGESRKRFRGGTNSSHDGGGRGAVGKAAEQAGGKQFFWPTQISCEMNLIEWHMALENARLLPELNHVLDGFKCGFDQGIPVHKIGDLRWYTPDNHSSASEVAEKIQNSIKEEVKAGRMFGPYSHEEVAQKFSFFRTSPLGSVVNADGKMRPINNLSYPKNDDEIKSVNSFVDKLDFPTTWDDFKTVSSFFRNNKNTYKLALFDWAKAYRQIPTQMSQWPFLMVKDSSGGLYVDTRITFGGVAGCGSFGVPADAWKRIMEHEFDVIKIFRWVDDNLFIKSNSSSCKMKDITNRSIKLGVSTSLEKCSDFADEQKFIGFIWNGENKTVRLTDKKLAERKEQIKLFLIQDADFKFNDAEVLAGRLNHVSFILPQLRCYIRSIYRWMNQWKKQWATRKIPEDVRVDLEFWISTLDTYTETRLCPASKPLEVHWVGDASTSFGIGVLIGQRWTQLRLKEDWRIATPPRTIAWLETVAIRIGILMLRETRNNIKGSNFIVYTDNTTTENVLAVVSKENVADGLSRGVRRPHEAVNRVWINIPDDLQHFMFHA